MFVPLVWRTDEGDNCSSASGDCGSMAIVGSDPSGAATSSAANDSPDADSATPTSHYLSKPGIHRFIGVAMVLVMVFAILLIWLYCYKRKTSTYPHRVSAYFCCGRRRKKSKWTNVALPVAEQSPEVEPQTPVVSEKERSQMLQSEPRGLIKEVSGGVVMYTEVPRPAMPKRERHSVDWDFERVRGVHYEARSPHRHPERGRSLRKSDNRR